MIAYFSCGIGDFIAIESFLDDKVKRQITEFHLFTRSAPGIIEAIKIHPYWQDLPVFVPYTEAEIRAFGVYAFYDIYHMRKITKNPWPKLDNATDFSGEVLYPGILTGAVKYKESLFKVDSVKCDVVIDRASNADDRMVAKGRNLTAAEIEYLIKKFHDKDIRWPALGKTSFDQALGLVSGCQHFAGVDSMLSVWAARQPGIESIEVKTINPIYVKWRKIYDPMERIKIRGGFS